LIPAALLLSSSQAAASKRPGRQTKERLAQKACLAGDPAKGVEILAELYVDTNDITWIFNQGRCYEQNRRYEDAIGRFREFLVKGEDQLSDAEKALAKKRNGALPTDGGAGSNSDGSAIGGARGDGAMAEVGAGGSGGASGAYDGREGERDFALDSRLTGGTGGGAAGITGSGGAAGPDGGAAGITGSGGVAGPDGGAAGITGSGGVTSSGGNTSSGGTTSTGGTSAGGTIGSGEPAAVEPRP
jgi:hypothetical protein